jgi:lysophospholipase L1-like esterase
MYGMIKSSLVGMLLLTYVVSSAEAPLLQASTESYDYAVPMKEVTKKFKGTQGVVLLFGDSLTYASSNTAWARYGAGQTGEVKLFLKWAHANEKSEIDGWHLASVDVQNGRSHTASSGMTTAELLFGGKNGLPALKDILRKNNPQIAVYMLGTNDMRAGESAIPVAVLNVEKALDVLLANNTIPVLSTIPPMKDKNAVVEKYNAELKKLAEKKKIPLIDLFGELKAINPELDDWLSDGVHLTAGNAAAAPTLEALKKSGYLARCYFNVLKLMEVKAKVIDSR